MHLQIHGKQIDVGAALRSHSEAKLSALVEKYFERGSSGTVTYSRDGINFRCDILVHLASGLTLQVAGTAIDAHGALDEALGRLESRLKRYLSRLKRHHRERGEPISAVAAPDYVIEDGSENDTGPTEPVIVAELTSDLKFLTVGEAVLQMNLLDAQALLFRNRGNDRLNLVYRRNDGHIGWIDPPEANRK